MKLLARTALVTLPQGGGGALVRLSAPGRTVRKMKITGAYRPTDDTMAQSDEVTVEGPDHAELVQQLRDQTPEGQVLLSVRVIEG